MQLEQSTSASLVVTKSFGSGGTPHQNPRVYVVTLVSVSMVPVNLAR